MSISLKQKLDFQRTAKIITESQYKKLLFENIEIPRELEKKVFDIFNSPKISNAIRKTISNLSPKDKEELQSTINSVITENSGDGFSSFKNIVDTVMATAAESGIDERYSEDVDPESIEYKVGNIAEKLGVAHLMTMGFLPGIVQSVSDYLLGTNFVETFINNTGGDPTVSAAIAAAAGLILGGCMWFLGKEMKGEKVTGSTPLFEKSTIKKMTSKKNASLTLKERLDLQRTAKIITESQYKKLLKEEKSWADVDKEIENKETQDLEAANSFLNTPQGKNAVRALKSLISKPYGYAKLDKVLQILNLSLENFKYAAKAAGMKFGGNNTGIRIDDANYLDPDVSITNQNGKWMVG